MAGHYWMLSGLTVAAAVTMGLGLGSYVTSPQQPRQADPQEAESSDYATSTIGADAASAADAGPVAIRCSGCGPSLAERRFAADQAAYDSYSVDGGMRDPMVQDYLAQEEAPERVPADIQRLAVKTDAPPVVPTLGGGAGSGGGGAIAPAAPTLAAGEGDRP